MVRVVPLLLASLACADALRAADRMNEDVLVTRRRPVASISKFRRQQASSRKQRHLKSGKSWSSSDWGSNGGGYANWGNNGGGYANWGNHGYWNMAPVTSSANAATTAVAGTTATTTSEQTPTDGAATASGNPLSATGERNGPSLTASMGIYPDASTTAAPGGILHLTFDETSGDITIYMEMQGLEADCSTSNQSDPNACGIRVHEGQVCTNRDAIGNALWQPTSQPSPWLNVRYNSNNRGSAKMILLLPRGNGFDVAENAGHALVVYGTQGQALSCGILYPLL